MTGNRKNTPNQNRIDLAAPPGTTTTQFESPGRQPGAGTKFNERYARLIFWMETVLATVAATLAVVTALCPTWIEQVFGADPDHHSGSAEWNVVLAFAFSAVFLAALARRNWRRFLAAA
jgi:hypothetical protein